MYKYDVCELSLFFMSFNIDEEIFKFFFVIWFIFLLLVLMKKRVSLLFIRLRILWFSDYILEVNDFDMLVDIENRSYKIIFSIERIVIKKIERKKNGIVRRVFFGKMSRVRD